MRAAREALDLALGLSERARTMQPSALSVTFVTDNLIEAREFYEKHFGAKASFDCGWYVVLKFGGDANGQEVGFMEPQNGASPYTGGSMLNLTFPDVDAVHSELSGQGIVPAMPLEDHPWGDRGFGVVDPLGTMVYCLTPIEATDEFKAFQTDLS